MLLRIGLLAAFQVAVGILLPGFCLRFLLRGWKRLDALPFPAPLLESIACGYLWNTILFLPASWLAIQSPATQWYVAAGKSALDLSLILGTVLLNRQVVGFLLRSLAPVLRFPAGLVVLTAVGCGLIGLCWFPHSLDCGQLLWTDLLLAGLPPTGNSGAVGYSALIYFPGVFLRGLPLVTTAAAFKPFLGLLLGLAVLLLLQAPGSRSLSVVALPYLVVLLVSNLGSYGFFQLGKDSVFGVVFSLMYLAMLIRYDTGEDEAAWPGALYFSCAIISGVITVPYLGLITVLYTVLALGRRNPFGFLAPLCLWGAPFGAVVLDGFLHSSPAKALVGLLALAGVCSLLRTRFQFLWNGGARLRYLVPVALVLLLLICRSLMPYKLPLVPWVDAQGNPVVEFRPPLDGVMTFRQLLTTFEQHTPVWLVGLGLLGMLVTCLHPRFGNNRALLALVLFIPAMICIPLALGRMSRPPIDPFHLWDMLRDVPLWYGGIIFGLFAFVFLDCLLTRMLSETWSRRVFIPLGVGVAALAFSANVDYFRQQFTWPHYTSIGGHQDSYVARLCEAVVRQPSASRHLLLATNSQAMGFMYSFQMYGQHVPVPVNFNDPGDTRAVFDKLPATLIGRFTDISHLLAYPEGAGLQVVELAHFPEQDESLYSLEIVEQPILRLSSTTFALSPIEGAHERERMLGTPFRWMRREANYDVCILEPGAYLLEGAVFTNFSSTSNELSILLNDQPIEHLAFASPDPKQPTKFSVRLQLRRPRNRLTLRSRLPETNFPNDPRPIAYGLVWPLSLQRCDESKPATAAARTALPSP
jgi:hypothetical protein